MAWSDINDSLRGSIGGLLNTRQRRAENMSDILGRIGKKRFDKATREDEQEYATGATQKGYDFESGESALERQARMDELLAELTARKESDEGGWRNARSVANIYATQGNEDKEYYADDAWVRELFKIYGGADIDYTTGEPIYDTLTNQDISDFRNFMYGMISEYPDDKKALAEESIDRFMNVLSRYYKISGGDEEDGGRRGGRGNNGIPPEYESGGSGGYIPGRGRDYDPNAIPVEPTPVPITSGIDAISSATTGARSDKPILKGIPAEPRPLPEDYLFEDFRGGEPETPAPDIDVRPNEQEAYNLVLSLLEKYGNNEELNAIKTQIEKQGSPLLGMGLTLRQINRIQNELE